MILVLGLYLVDGIGCLPTRQADAQFGAPDGETPQRMCVGIIKEEILIGFERTQKTRNSDGKSYDTLNWYHGDLESARISPSVIQTGAIEGETSTLLRRWQWEEGAYGWHSRGYTGPSARIPQNCGDPGLVMRDVPNSRSLTTLLDRRIKGC